MRRLGWMWLLPLLAACPKEAEEPQQVPDAGPPAPAQLQEKEPNGRPEQALRLSASSDVRAALSADPSAPDEDWYLLESGEAGTRVDVRVSGLPGGDVALEVYDEDRNRLVAVNSEGEGQPERLPNLHLTGRRLLKVYPARKGAGGAYGLEVRYGAPQPGEEQEPNDRAVDGNVVPLGTPVTGLVGHAGDEDWYRFDLPERALPEGTPAPQAPGEAAPSIPGAIPVAPQAPAGDEQAAGQQAPGEQADTAPAPVDEPSAGAGAEAEAEPGTVPEAVPPAPPSIPGSQPVEAGADAAVPSPPPAAEPEAPAVALRIELTGVPGVRHEVRVLSEAEAPLFEVRGKEGEGLSLRNIGVRGVDRLVYVVVRSAWSGTGRAARRGFNPDAPYTLTVSQEEAGANAELEPNDELARATPLPAAGGFREGFLAPKTDVDHYVLRPSQPVLADFHLSGVERLDLALSVVERTPEGEKVVLEAREGEVKEPEQLNNVACAGECFVRVESALRKVEGRWVKDYENSEQTYRLTVTTTPDTGAEEREPNDATECATPLSFGQPVRGTVYPRKDSDVYRLDLSEREVRTALRATLLGILKVDVGLYLYRLEADGKRTLVQTADRARGEQPEVIRYSAEPGVYLFEVRDVKGRESNFQDSYQLAVEAE